MRLGPGTGRCHRCRRAGGRRRTGRCRAGRSSAAAGGRDELASSLFAALILLRRCRSRSTISSSATRWRVLPTASAGRTRREQLAGLRCGQDLLRPAGDQLEQQRVQLADHPGVVRADPSSPVHQQPQRPSSRSSCTTAQAGHARPRPAATECASAGIGLAALPRGEHPHPRRQLGRHVHDRLAVGEQPLGQVPADALAALDRPHPLRPLRRRPASPRSRPGRCRTDPYRVRSGSVPYSTLTEDETRPR